MGIEDITAPRRPARGSLIDALTAREAFQPSAAAGQTIVIDLGQILSRAQLNARDKDERSG